MDDKHLDSLLPPLRLNRRGFLTAATASGFCLAAGPVMAQTAIKTDAKGLTAGWVEIPAAGGNMRAYRARPEKATRLPTVLVVPEIFGVHEYIQDVCRRLAHVGYQAIAPDLFARQGDPTKYTEIAKLQAEIISKIPDAQVIGDLDATAKWAGSHDGDPAMLGIVGFCWGGRFVWLYSAHNRGLKAGAAFYGALRGKRDDTLRPKFPVDIAGDMHAPVRGAYGAEDTGITQDDVAAMREALAKGSAAAKASVIDVYQGAGHAFHADYRPSYRKAQAEQAWGRMLEWFSQHNLAPSSQT
ncbi:dienelactone hydrolase family protein [Bordetella bronchialis]|uniref:Carboxymethylenebutenolidase n=1 Tax=Bordetella bronchialis TaxID=463025 RepID=A0A193G145_9BORD|nr:dienelactone hydrolase family protein [Bordetella bronchialis]ANN68583.1 carboxymethylenebutenolidase [Bordetella bronchialis]ANN73722.1 carboxymethylenebutenolidase [Bordetella bronchialis]